MFLDNLDMRLVRDNGPRPIFMTLAPFRYQSKVAQKLIYVPMGFTTDGPSIPEIAMSFTGYPGMRAAVVHDFICEHPDVLPREMGDQVFHEALLICGVDPATAEAMYLAVAGYTDQLKRAAAPSTPYTAG